MNEIAARLLNLIIGVFAMVALMSLIAYCQNKDAIDEQAARQSQVARK